MRKLWFPLTMLAAVLLSACAQATAPAALASTATSVPPTRAPVATSAPARCTVESTLDKIAPTQDNRFAPISDKDWTLGPADAKITFLEFSDFM